MGDATIGLAGALLIVATVQWSRRVSRQRADVLAGLVGEPIRVGLTIGASRGDWPFDAVVESVDKVNRSVRFASLASSWGPGRRGYTMEDWVRWADEDDEGNVRLFYVRWAEARDGTRWFW